MHYAPLIHLLVHHFIFIAGFLILAQLFLLQQLYSTIYFSCQRRQIGEMLLSCVVQQCQHLKFVFTHVKRTLLTLTGRTEVTVRDCKDVRIQELTNPRVRYRAIEIFGCSRTSCSCSCECRCAYPSGSSTSSGNSIVINSAIESTN